MNTYLLNVQGDQTIETQNNGKKLWLAYSHPNWYQPKVSLAADFGDIASGDRLLLCRDSKLHSAATVERVIDDLDMQGKPIRLLSGQVPERFSGQSVATVGQELARAGLGTLRTVTERGFKQGAFCEGLTTAQAEHILKSARPSSPRRG